MHICSAMSAMWCALHAMTSWGCRAAAMFVVPGPQVATAGATPWSSWWAPSVFRARTLAMAAPTGRRITTVKTTHGRAPTCRAAALARPAALLAPWRRYCAILPSCTNGPAQPRLRLVLASTLNSVTVSILSPPSVLLQTKSPRISTCSC